MKPLLRTAFFVYYITMKKNNTSKKNNISNNIIYDVIIVGAGASGLFCGAAAEPNDDGFGTDAYGLSPDMAAEPNGGTCETEKTRSLCIDDSSRTSIPSFRSLILEKTSCARTKLLMSGSGQCNITHDGSIKDFVSCYGENGKKIRSCIYRHSNLSLMKFLRDNGVELFIREDGKVFPASMDAHEVLYMLLRRIKSNGFEIRYSSPVTGIKKVSCDGGHHGELWLVSSGDTIYTARNVIIATGGCSYPSTGSDGSMFPVLSRDLDIEITSLRPALSSIQVQDYPYAELSGISHKNAHVSIWHDGRKTAEACDDLLFTHRDMSGPAVINISKYALQNDILKVNYIFPVNYHEALDRLKSASNGSKAGLVSIISSEFNLPKRFCRILTERSGEALKAIARSLTEDQFIIASVSGFNRAMATAGGICLDQINTSCFSFKAYPSLYAVGEALDVDGMTGGYNLQFAYSSAVAAMGDIMAKK